MSKIEVTEERKLRWPDGAERTRIKERKSQSAWRVLADGYKHPRDWHAGYWELV